MDTGRAYKTPTLSFGHCYCSSCLGGLVVRCRAEHTFCLACYHSCWGGRVAKWGEPMRKAMGRWRRGGQPVPHLVLLCLREPVLHGRILAAFHKTSSALPVVPATLHHGHAAMQPCGHAATPDQDNPRLPSPKSARMARQHSTVRQQRGQASGSGWRDAGWLEPSKPAWSWPTDHGGLAAASGGRMAACNVYITVGISSSRTDAGGRGTRGEGRWGTMKGEGRRECSPRWWSETWTEPPTQVVS